jgi:hypothetical protein
MNTSFMLINSNNGDRRRVTHLVPGTPLVTYSAAQRTTKIVNSRKKIPVAMRWCVNNGEVA